MMKAAAALLRKIWRQISRQIFHKNRTLTLPVPGTPPGATLGGGSGDVRTAPGTAASFAR
jgi:hypothetical protein